MKSNYDVLGNYIRLIDTRNKDKVTNKVMGINIDKFFMPSVANVIGTDLSKYKLITKGKFACNPMHVGRDERLPVALYEEVEPALVSPAYFMFEIIDNTVLDENYLMMWFRRAEFDRICWLHTDSSVRGGITWDDICRMEIPVPDIGQQRKIVEEYKIVEERIILKRKINDNLTEQMVNIQKELFPLSEDKDENATLFEYCEKIYSGGTPSTTEDSYWNGEYFWLSSGETSQSYITNTEKTITLEGINNSSTKLAEKGSIVIASAGQGLTRGQTSLLFVDTYVNQSVVVIKPKPNLSGLLYSNLKGRYNEMRVLSDLDSIRGSLTTKTVSSLPVCFPNADIAKSFSCYCGQLFRVIYNNLQEIDTLNTLKATIISSILSR
ncbi:hypothetical protein C804_02662 [Lachnospiraceae bacterium A4]|jgi:type I restriction enzyme S subunit|nr:hypothetical protein C804_02662 [Lachnospiraceae bacterium A4]